MSARVTSETQQTNAVQPSYPNTQKVFVGNIPFNCSTEQFQSCFNTLNGYITADVIRRYGSHLSRGFGFVVLSTDQQAEDLINSTTPVTIADRELRMSVYGDTGEKSRTFKIFVDNLDDGTSEEDLKFAFSTRDGGEVLSVFVNSNSHKTTGVVMVSTHELFKSFLDSAPTLNNVPLNVKPFRKQNRSKNPKNVYDNGFQAGQVVGFQMGLQKGITHGTEKVVPVPKLSRNKTGVKAS